MVTGKGVADSQSQAETENELKEKIRIRTVQYVRRLLLCFVNLIDHMLDVEQSQFPMTHTQPVRSSILSIFRKNNKIVSLLSE